MSSTRSESPLVFSAVPNAESEEWVNTWRHVLARGRCSFSSVCCPKSLRYVKDLIDSPVVAVDADTSVEDACDVRMRDYDHNLIFSSCV